ncbi:MAG: ATP-dependent DNA helicase RecG [Candidatus Levybacteria bacterium RIFCSPHIGHO2_01_FULL_37_17]|nr:MAG: ATP-dependent DNA helicase RecG [Candidatus Levybacteria bacterium RIFCSPHIGHO2_01_FULL_37_17]OGH36778.1 MAG: ATP-dependent DNA helicase RecG [Candidatus Levybacteria bacterium RIFCSPLOWO2_01_FULL_38_23]
MDLNTPVGLVSRSYKMYAGRLSKLGIFTIYDFLLHIPFRYEDYSLISKIGQVQAEELITVKGKIEKIENRYLRRWKTLQKAQVTDGTGTLDVIWFNQPYIPKAIKVGDEVSLSGKIELDKNKLIMKSPDYELVVDNETIHTGRIVPIYPETKGISSKWLRRQVYKVLDQFKDLQDYLPKETLRKNNLGDLSYAINSIHFPKSMQEVERAKERLSFDEMLKLHLLSLKRKKEWKKDKVNPWKIDKNKINELIKILPFELTDAQKNAVEEILRDLSSNLPMNRLLEGDVGSGKTIVAAITTYASFLNGFQTAFMAPTEILSSQHFQTLDNLLSPLEIKVKLFTSGSKKIDDFDVAVGTHALIYKKVQFKKLGLVVIDEQQRFGVEQRAKLRLKGKNPHILTMTATPIPRTVALTMYGDLDLSILDKMPKGRINIKTWLVPPSKREGAYKWIKEKIEREKDQVFIVCPFIEESENMITVKAAKKEFERLSKEVFPNLKLGLLHGKLKSGEKNDVLNDFKNKKIDILVSTPVVEVGIDVPAATIMLIEEAERFGLAQLHQLRGRVGRSSRQSYCLLFTSSNNPLTLRRLKSMEKIYSGPELAELDLKLRGPGQIYGTTQHGTFQLKVASFSDIELIAKTKKEAEILFEKLHKYPKLTEQITLGDKKVSPD